LDAEVELQTRSLKIDTVTIALDSCVVRTFRQGLSLLSR
jgi:hypothetical protein